METRLLGQTGLRVSVLSLGTMTFGGQNRFAHMGTLGVEQATEMVDRCLDAGVNLFDTADIYSNGIAEEVLGAAIGKRRDDVLIATKLNARISDDPNDLGQSRHHIVRACEASLRRLGTDWIDLYQVHGIDELTAFEESLRALDDLVRQGKIRYIGASNFSAWHLMKGLATADHRGYTRYASLQAYYNLAARELEHELIPLCLDQHVGLLVWSPLAAGFLTGKQRRGQPIPERTRRATLGTPGTIDPDQGFDIIDTLADIATQRSVTIPQVALNWLLHRPAVTSVILGARTLDQLTDNLAAATWQLTPEELDRLNQTSDRPLPYPYWHQRTFAAERLVY